MNPEHDPIDNALRLLRSDQWAGMQPYNPDLEKRLMQTPYSLPYRSRRLSRAIIVVAAVLALSGGTFAATGGIAKLRQWLFTVEIEGVSAQILVPENGEGTIRFETEEGVATVAVQKTNTPENGEMTQVKVVHEGDGTHDEDVVRMIRRRADAADAQTQYSVADLGDAEPYADWTDERGAINEVFLLPSEDGEGTAIFLATTPEGAEEPTVRLVATPPIDMLAGEVEPEVTFEDGVLSISFDDGNGRGGEIKLRIQRNAGDDALADGLDIATPDGKVKIKMAQPGEEE